MKKKIVRLSPARGVSLEDAERHYRDVHFRFASTTFRHSIDAVIAYHSNHAVGQFDLMGGFSERPDAWRFVFTQWDDSHDDGHAVGWLPERIRGLFFVDRENCIDETSSCEVDEHVVIDRLRGHTSLVKYLFRYAPDQVGPQAEFERYYEHEHAPTLRAAATSCPGLRKLVSNRVLQEAAVSVREDGHTEYSGGYMETVSSYRFEELWFDNDDVAAEFFHDPCVLGLLRDSPYGKVRGYRVEEVCGVDRR